MNLDDGISIDLGDLTEDALRMAYRKAKVDLYYSNDMRASDLLKYEQSFEQRISKLLASLRIVLEGNGEPSILVTDEFCGGYSLISKDFELRADTSSSVDEADVTEADDESLYPALDLKRELREKLQGEVGFRVLSRCSIDMHVVGALWLGTVGAKLESLLGFAPRAIENAEKNTDAHSSSFGDRLRRKKSGEYNWNASGSYKPYGHQYRNWQAQGLRTMSEALEREERIVAVTADFRAFFPTLSAEFLLDEALYGNSGIASLSAAERRLTEILIASMRRWAESTSLDLPRLSNGSRVKTGLPIGFPASGLVANLALANFDRIVRDELNPLYYGRYVDDLMIVLRRAGTMRSSSDVWHWVSQRFALVEGESLEVDKATYLYKGRLLGAEGLEFSRSKTKIYFLEGDSGKVLLASLGRSMQERTSEWRALPDIPATADRVPESVVRVVGADGEAAENFRLVHSFSVARAGFALKLRDFEALVKDLPPGEWKEHRTAFLRTASEFVFSAPEIFRLERYLPRVLQVALMTEDWSGLGMLLRSLKTTLDQLLDPKKQPGLASAVNGGLLADPSTALTRWSRDLLNRLEDTVRRTLVRAVPETAVESMIGGQESFSTVFESILEALRNAECRYCEYFTADLAAVPFRSVVLTHEWSQHLIPDWKSSIAARPPMRVAERLGQNLDDLARLILLGADDDSRTWSATGYDSEAKTVDLRNALIRASGFGYATRPFSSSELLLLTRAIRPTEQAGGDGAGRDAPGLQERWRGFIDAMFVLRGIEVDGELFEFGVDGEAPVLRIPSAESEKFDGRARIAPASIETTRDQLAAAIHGSPDLSLSRYRKLIAVVRNVLSDKERADILVCPELSIPREWFSRFAYKLQSAGTSLIAGVEYGISAEGVRNQVWANFAHCAWGFPSSVLYVQDKQRPARGEERNLLAEAQTQLAAPSVKWMRPPVLEFRGMHLAMLICSEVTNLEYRSSLRSMIDALFVVEWNQDVRAFSSIIESSSYDMHAYVVQANNRLHGDTRIRAPYRNEWKRDIVKVSGGMHDNAIVGEIDFASLRRFQSSHDQPGGEYKSLPDGFELPRHRTLMQDPGR